MTPPTSLLDFVAEIVHSHPSAQLEFSPHSSGVCFVWVSLNDRNFVLEYDPKDGVGVSENLPTTPPFVGHDEFFPRLEDGIDRLRSFLRSSIPGIPQTATS
jgi:hypothetical protein